jgi:hypothetical protein
MSLRLKTGFWIAAYRQTVEQAGGHVTIARHGDDTSGHIFIQLQSADRSCALLAAMTDLDGGRRWRVVTSFGFVSQEISLIVEREIKRDPDCWVIDVDSKNGDHFLLEPIEGRLREDQI